MTGAPISGRRASRRIAAALLLLGLSACPSGTPVSRFPPATGPHGVETTAFIRGSSRPLRGELLAVHDDTLLLVRQGARIVVVPIRRNSVVFQGLSARVSNGAWQGDARSARLASRYPHGLTPERLRALLASMGQSAPDTVRAR